MNRFFPLLSEEIFSQTCWGEGPCGWAFWRVPFWRFSAQFAPKQDKWDVGLREGWNHLAWKRPWRTLSLNGISKCKQCFAVWGEDGWSGKLCKYLPHHKHTCPMHQMGIEEETCGNQQNDSRGRIFACFILLPDFFRWILSIKSWLELLLFWQFLVYYWHFWHRNAEWVDSPSLSDKDQDLALLKLEAEIFKSSSLLLST